MSENDVKHIFQLKKLILNEKGVALLTTLVLSFVALGFIAALLYFLNSSTEISGIQTRYQTSLEAAKGGSDFVMNQLVTGLATCEGGTKDLPDCDSGDSIDLGSYNSVGQYNLSATMLSSSYDNVTETEIYAVRVNAKNTTNDEKSTIEFVYRVY